MIALLTALLAIPALLIFVLAAFYGLEIFGAFLPPRKPASASAGPIAVVVPAHNESAGLLPTIADIKAALRPQDRLLVVADNCDDDTAEVAMRAGASVLIRNDSERRGKGFALQFALDALKDDPPAIVAFVDADCRLEEGALMRVAEVAAEGRPAQALYLMQAGQGAPTARRVAEFTWALMNRVRMGGLYTLFDACRLTGSGMALPWEVAEELDLASGEIVEDLALGLHLTSQGAAPVFCADALVYSIFPCAEENAAKQRARWEHGSLRLAIRRAPALFAEAVSKGDVRLAAAALDLAIPPFILFLAIAGGVLVVSALFLPVGVTAPFVLAVWSCALLSLATISAWAAFGRSILPASQLGALADYVVGKVRVYGAKARKSTREWTRTGRDGEGGAS